MRPAIIAIDFDGTIVEHMFPEVGEPVQGAIEVMKELQAKGHRLMLWTMRSGKTLEDAVRYCKDNGIEFWGINENPEQTATKWSESAKQYAQFYVDDAAIGCPLIFEPQKRPYVNWDVVKEHFQAWQLL